MPAPPTRPDSPAPPGPVPTRRRAGRRARNAELVAAELERRGIEVTWLDTNAMIAEAGGLRLGYGFGLTHGTGRAGVAAAKRKDIARQLLIGAGLDVPRGRSFSGAAGEADAGTYARALGEVVLTRPVLRSVRPVVADAWDPRSFRRAWAAVAGNGSTKVWVEERFAGMAARFLVIGGRCVAMAGYSGSAVTEKWHSADLAGAVHPSFRDIAARAVLAFPGLDVAAVTIAAVDLSRRCAPGHYVVCEIDVIPALADYSYGGTDAGDSAAGGVAAAVVDLHLGVTRPARTPRRPRRPRRWARAGASVGDAVTGLAPSDGESVDGFSSEHTVNSQLLARALVRRGAEITWLASGFFVADVGGTRLGYRGVTSHMTGGFATNVTGRKDLARQVLARAGLETAEGRAFPRDGYEAAADYADRLGDAVVKPVDGSKGNGVTVGVRGRRELERAWRLAARYSRQGVLVERVFSGIELRCLVVDDRCVAVLRRLPPYVVGNGRDTVEQLIEAKNELRLRNPSLRGCAIRMNPHRRDQLRRQGYDLTDILPDGRQVVLDHKAGISTGGESLDVTDDVHPSLKAAAVRATEAIPGLGIAGVDILTADPHQPAAKGSYVVCEINSGPGIDIHHFPIHGTPRDVAGAIVDFHLSQLGLAAPGGGFSSGGREGTRHGTLRRLHARLTGRPSAPSAAR